MESLEEQRSFLASTPAIWPVRGWVTSGFGYRFDPFIGEEKIHEGIDISTPIGTPILTPANGVVSFIGNEESYGITLIIDHGYGVSTRYAHLSKVLVRLGQRVRRGDKVAQVGQTGRTTGPHLHYEVRLHGVPVNPKNYFLD